MGQPSRVLYLPPGVVPGPQAPAQQIVGQPGIPFDRTFFEQVLPSAIAEFSKQSGHERPMVELLTVDGMTHHVVGISGVADTWAALHTRVENHDHDVQIFVPYTTIFRLAIHGAEDERGHLGFVLGASAQRP